MEDHELVTKMKDYVGNIRHEVNRIKLAREEAGTGYRRTLKELDEQLDSVRKKCPHLETRYYPDASGNNDSYYECKWCGAEV